MPTMSMGAATKFLAALVVTSVQFSRSALATNESEWLIGFYGPITSMSHHSLAAAVAFDLDLRKHFEPDLIQQLGPPIVDIPNLHPLLQQARVIIGTSHSSADVGSKTALDWLFPGRVLPQKVMAIVGGFHSAVASRVASLASSLGTPQIAWGATSPALTDKLQYPFFLRTIPPDTIQGQAMWEWMQYFSIRSAVMLYAEESYGEGLLGAVTEAAGALSHLIKPVSMPFMPDPSTYNWEVARTTLHGVKESGSRFVLMALVGTEAISAMYLLEQEGVFGGPGGYQVLGAESTFPLDDGPRLPSRTSLVGFLQLYPVAVGPLWPEFEELWTNLTPADLYSPEAVERYMLDSMQVRLENGRAEKLDDTDFKSLSSSEPGIHMFPAFVFDAAYTVVLAVNALLNKGIGLASMLSNGTALLEEMKATKFDGVTGRVGFDEQGERDAQYHVWNLQSINSSSGGAMWAIVGLYDVTSKSFKNLAETVWATGQLSSTVPNALLSCPAGFQRESTTNLCEKCRPGIGCGFQIQDGFPIGILNPLTSIDQQLLAIAVLVDLDFRKNTDPEILDRFGPPIIHIPDLHPNLRIKMQLGTSNSEVGTAVETALDWFTGAGDFYKIAGIVGEHFSSVTGPVASTAAVFSVPMVGWSASSPSLSDKTLYPWFSRVNPPDTLQAQGFWAWMQHFDVPSIAFVYTREIYGEGVFQATKDLATIAGQAGRIISVGIRFQTINDDDINDELEAARNIKNSGSKFIVFAIPSVSHFTAFMYVLETVGLLYGAGAYQIFGAETILLGSGTPYVPSMGLPIGTQRLQQVTQGQLYPKLRDMWYNMSVEDLYGPDATRRYMLNHLKVLLPDGATAMLTEDDFKEEPFYFFVFLFDAIYTFIVAINSLLNKGVPPEEIYGAALLTEVRNTTFEGATGFVSFDEFGDRATGSELWNLHLDNQGQLKDSPVALWKPGALGFSTIQGSATFEDELTWARGALSPLAPEELTACPEGYHWDETANICLACERNMYSSGLTGKGARCLPCDPGWVGITPSAAIGCEQCPKGRFRINEDECVACPVGMYGADEGQSACIDCGIGNYSSIPGLTGCEVCGAGFGSQRLFKTMSWVDVGGGLEYFYLTGATQMEDCGCDRGTRRDGNNECIECSEGMLCKGMNDVEVLPGYFAGPIVNGGLSVFKCHGDTLRCKGGLPGQTCAEGREGITCAECMSSKTPADDGKCVDCGGGDHGTFIVILLLAAVMLAFVYFVVDTQNRAKGSHALVLAGTSVGIFTTTIQLLAVLGSLPLEYEDPLKAFMDSFSFNLELVRINCVSKPSPLQRYTIKLTMILVVVCFLIALHGLVVIFYYRRKSGWRLESLIAGIGAMFMVFYITVTSTVLEPLQCQSHPNTRWTILSYPSILCWEGDEHQTMLILGIIVFLFVPLTFMVVCILAVREFPNRMRMGDTVFLKAFSFLFIRFSASQHTFILKQMMRNFGVALVLVIPNVVLQIFTLEVILLASYTASLVHRPWRVEEATWLDCLQGAFSVLVVALASLFLEEETGDLKAMAWLALVFISASILFTISGIGYGLLRKYVRRSKPFQYFLCHHKAGAGAYTRLLKLQLLEHPKVVAGVFLDSDNLDNLDCLFDYVGNSTSMLVVVCSAEIFSRPWCLGEMCTARLHQVPLCKLGLPSMRLPDEEFMDRLAVTLQGVEALAENGIDLQMVRITLEWIHDTPLFTVPDAADMDVMNMTAERLANKDWSDVVRQGSADTLPTVPHVMSFSKQKSGRGNDALGRRACPLIYDRSNLEAEAAAMVLRKLLIPLMAHRSALVPEPWKSKDIPGGGQAVAIVVLCSNGIFADEDTLRLFDCKCDGVLLPVLAEPAFRFPGSDLAHDLLKQQAWMDREKAHAIAGFVHGLFKEIAVSFAAQMVGEAELKLAANQISQRLLHAGSKGSSRPLVGNSTTSATSTQSSQLTQRTFGRVVSPTQNQDPCIEMDSDNDIDDCTVLAV